MEPVFSRIGLLAFLIYSSASALSGPIREKQTLYPNGKVKEKFTYYMDENGREIKDGPAEEWFPDGAKKGLVTWKNGVEDGSVLYYFASGRKSYEAHYLQGRKSGFATVWYENGQKQWQTVFRDGKTHGLWREWFPDGKKKFEANYSEGKLDGLATWWYENGRVQQERSYQAGQQVKGSVKEWDKSGKQTFPPADLAASGNGKVTLPQGQDSQPTADQTGFTP